MRRMVLRAILPEANAPQCQLIHRKRFPPAGGPQGGQGSGQVWATEIITYIALAEKASYLVAVGGSVFPACTQLENSRAKALTRNSCLEALEMASCWWEKATDLPLRSGVSSSVQWSSQPSFTEGFWDDEQSISADGRSLDEGENPLSLAVLRQLANKHRVLFWMAIAQGLSSRECRIRGGHPLKRLKRSWFRNAGGMPPIDLTRRLRPFSLSFS